MAERTALVQDFAAMDGLMLSDQLEFDAILETCAAIQDKVNRLACGQRRSKPNLRTLLAP